ncbi:hypothetical protein SLE2022_141270 [Rubroshorea leprosula]
MDWLSASARPLIVSDLDHTVGPSAVTVYPSSVEKTLHECIHELKGWDGDKQGKMFWVWVDPVLSTQNGSSITWLVNFNKWEPCGNVWCCCATLEKISAKRRKLEHYNTWLQGSKMKEHSAWLL